MRRGQPCPSGPRSGLVRSLTCANDKELSRGRRSANAQRSGRGADAPKASLDPKGMPLTEALDTAACLASGNAKAPRGHEALSPAL